MNARVLLVRIKVHVRMVWLPSTVRVPPVGKVQHAQVRWMSTLTQIDQIHMLKNTFVRGVIVLNILLNIF